MIEGLPLALINALKDQKEDIARSGCVEERADRPGRYRLRYYSGRGTERRSRCIALPDATTAEQVRSLLNDLGRKQRAPRRKPLLERIPPEYREFAEDALQVCVLSRRHRERYVQGLVKAVTQDPQFGIGAFVSQIDFLYPRRPGRPHRCATS